MPWVLMTFGQEGYSGLGKEHLKPFIFKTFGGQEIKKYPWIRNYYGLFHWYQRYWNKYKKLNICSKLE